MSFIDGSFVGGSVPGGGGGGGGSGTPRQHAVTAENISGVDQNLVDGLDFAPESAASVTLELNTMVLVQGVHFSLVGGTLQTIRWLGASNGLPLEADDTLIAKYRSA